MATAEERLAWIHSFEHDLVQMRHDLHKHPELAFKEFRTQEIVLRELQLLGLKGQKIAQTGVAVTISGAHPGKTVALRADMDALPMSDESNLPYASVHPGICHACGHDAHTTILLGVARTLVHHRNFSGNVMLIFQPSEEQLPGGAPSVLQSGVLDHADAIFGLHVWQPLPFGKAATSLGPMMASPDDFTIAIKGRGGHASMPDVTIDPIVVAAHIITALQTIVSRSIGIQDDAVISVTQVHAGTAMNVIPETALLYGTLRTLTRELRDSLPHKIEQIATNIAQAFGASAEFILHRGYPAVINDPAMAKLALETASDLFGEHNAIIADPTMGGEDFAYYLEKIPGAFVFLGMGTKHPHHHPQFDANDGVLVPGVHLLTELALRYLG